MEDFPLSNTEDSPLYSTEGFRHFNMVGYPPSSMEDFPLSNTVACQPFEEGG